MKRFNETRTMGVLGCLGLTLASVGWLAGPAWAACPPERKEPSYPGNPTPPNSFGQLVAVRGTAAVIVDPTNNAIHAWHRGVQQDVHYDSYLIPSETFLSMATSEVGYENGDDSRPYLDVLVGVMDPAEPRAFGFRYFKTTGSGTNPSHIEIVPTIDLRPYPYDGSPDDERFGQAVAIRTSPGPGRYAVGLPGADLPPPPGLTVFANAGVVEVFDDSMDLRATLTAPEPMANKAFGSRLAIDGDWMFIGSIDQVFTYQWDEVNASWAHRGTITAPGGSIPAGFAIDASASPVRALINAVFPPCMPPCIPTAPPYPTYFYECELSGTSWSLVDSTADGEGSVVAFEADRAVSIPWNLQPPLCCGCPVAAVPTTLYRRTSGAEWLSQGSLSPNPQGYVSVSMDSETILIGSSSDMGDLDTQPDQCPNVNPPDDLPHGAVYFYDLRCADCNLDNIPDSTQLNAQTDCDGNTTLDECELAENDCNLDGIHDSCQSASDQCPPNGTLDECESAYWNGGTSSFTEDTNWTPFIGLNASVPTAQAVLNNGEPAELNGGHMLCEMIVGGAGPSQLLSIGASSSLTATASVVIQDDGEIALSGTSSMLSSTVGGVTIEDGGTLSGVGVVNGPVYNDGTIETAGPALPLRFTGVVSNPATPGDDAFISAASGEIHLDLTTQFVNGMTGRIDLGSGTMLGTLRANVGPTNDGDQTVGGGVYLDNGDIVTPGPVGGLFQTLTNNGYIEGCGRIFAEVDNYGDIAVANASSTHGCANERLTITGKLHNFSGGVVYIQGDAVPGYTAGTDWVLVVNGYLGDPGSTLWDFGVFIPRGADYAGAMFVTQDVTLSAGSRFELPGGLLQVGRDMDFAVNAPDHLDLSTTTVRLNGPPFGGGQDVERMSTNSGSSGPAGDAFVIDRLEIVSPTTVRLVDMHDNDSGAGPETAYIRTLHVATSGVTINTPVPIYVGQMTGSAPTVTGGGSIQPFTPPGAPAATVTSVTSRRANPNGPGGFCDAVDATAPFKVTEPHSGGANQIRIGFDVPPGGDGSDWTLEESTCTSGYAPSPDQANGTGVLAPPGLVISFSPALDNAKTYRINFGPSMTSIAGQSVQVRVLAGDATGDGLVNAADRSAIVGAWTGAQHFSCTTDISNDGSTNAADRSAVVGAWTNPSANCAP